jgi:hypothetical protein
LGQICIGFIVAKSIIIGKKEYRSKKEAISYYRSILNSYNFGQTLNESDFADLIDLLNYWQSEDETESTFYVEYIKVSKVQFNTKCFEVFYSDKTSCYISYLLCINNQKYTSEKLFYNACRNSVKNDIHAVKSHYFKGCGGLARCQETGILSKWEELVIDHRQPNTFSVIIDRFKELNNIDIESIQYNSDEKNNIVFSDISLSEKFREYHNEKANLRIVRRECNSKRIGMSRIKKTNKDLIIK